MKHLTIVVNMNLFIIFLKCLISYSRFFCIVLVCYFSSLFIWYLKWVLSHTFYSPNLSFFLNSPSHRQFATAIGVTIFTDSFLLFSSRCADIATYFDTDFFQIIKLWLLHSVFNHIWSVVLPGYSKGSAQIRFQGFYSV